MEVTSRNNVNGAGIFLGYPNNYDKQKFKIVYNDNGYSRILTKVSKDSKCIDLEGFSIVQGGNILQWDFLSGGNQAWRFMRIDSLDHISSVKLIIESGNGIQIYPNPSKSGDFAINFEKLNLTEKIEISVFNTKGGRIYKETIVSDPVHHFDFNLLPGIYLIQVKTNAKQYKNKLVVS